MYITKSQIENYLGVSINDALNSTINSWILAAQIYVENYTGVKFENTEDTTKYYDGNGLRELYIDDFITVESVTTLTQSGDDDSSLTENEDYYLYPLNDTPKHIIKMTPESSVGCFSKGKKRVKVVGNFGYASSVPSDIQLVITKLVAQVYNQQNKGGEIVSSERLGDYQVSFAILNKSAMTLGVQQILDLYQIITI